MDSDDPPGNYVPDDPRDLRQLGFKSSAAEAIRDVLSLDTRYRLASPSVHLWRVRSTCLPLRLRQGDVLIVDREAVPRPGGLVLTLAGRVEPWDGKGEPWGAVVAWVREVWTGREGDHP